MRFKNTPKIILILLFLAPPLAIWLSMEPFSARFGSFSQAARSAGQIFGLSGMSLFCLAFLLKTRARWLDRAFLGMDKAYVNHHNVGAAAFMLLLFHPLALAVRFIPQSVRAAALFLIPSFPAVLYGEIGLGLMIILLAITFFAKLKYNVWKFSHKFLMLAFAFGVLHMLTISSDVSRNYLLKSYLALLVLVSFSSVIYSIYFSKRYRYEVAYKRQLNESIVEIALRPVGKAMSHKPGQFAFFRFFDSSVSKEEHPFSICSGPKEKNLKIVAKNLGDYTKDMGKIEIGAKASVEGPFGSFLADIAKNSVWIAGGIGIAPFLGKINSIAGDEKVTLFYSVNALGEAVYSDNLSAAGNLNYHLWVTEEKGYLGAEKIKEACPGFFQSDFYLCGPPPMMKSIKKQLKELGIAGDKIHSEEFNLL